MTTLKFRFGRARVVLSIHGEIPLELFPIYIREFEGSVLPPFNIHAHLHFGDAAQQAEGAPLPRRFALPEGTYSIESEIWNFHCALTPGPERSDYWPTRCVNPILNFLFMRHGVLPLHASAAVRDGMALVYTGPSGSGKSTCADFHNRNGATILADDRLLVWEDSGSVQCTPSFERANPFQRWTKRVPEADPPRAPLPEPPWGVAYPIAALNFPRVEPKAPSIVRPLSRAETHARFAVGGAGDIGSDWNLPPGFAMTLGTEAEKLLAGR